MRSVLLTAALSILGEQGAGAMTVRSVATTAGCSTTGVYTWFGGKAGLVEAIFIDGFQNFGEAIRAAAPDGTDAKPLSGMALAYRLWALANPTQYLVMFGAAVPDYQPSDEAIAIAIATFEDLVVATRASMDVLNLDGTARDIAHHLWAGIHGYVSLELSKMDMAGNDDERADRFLIGLARLMRGCMR
ncbi:MAG: TetR/AcrR family transcriptional regulator [Ilumatobacteraceae bacterium]